MSITSFTLPSSPTIRRVDRFSILDEDAGILEDEYGLVPFWEIFKAVVKEPAKTGLQITQIIDTMLCTLNGTAGIAGDFGSLKIAIQCMGSAFFDQVWPVVVKYALRMPEYYPGHQIAMLRAGESVDLPREHVACLVAHQLLGTFTAPPGRDGFYDFTIWYNSAQRHPLAVNMYFEALFMYFSTLEEELLRNKPRNVEFTLHGIATSPILPVDWHKIPVIQPSIVHIDVYSTETLEAEPQKLNSAVVISANKDIGFGQSATQEEIYTGNCPEACPEVLFTPTLGTDEVLVIRGARPMLRIKGQRRDLTWNTLPEGTLGGRMIVMDALELDEASPGEDDGLADLSSSNINRELVKAFVAFSAWPWNSNDEGGIIWTGPWGCGAFNGDPGIKMTILWIAASLAGKNLHILLDESYREFAQQFEMFIEMMKGRMVQDLSDRLSRMPKNANRLDTMRWLLNEAENPLVDEPKSPV